MKIKIFLVIFFITNTTLFAAENTFDQNKLKRMLNSLKKFDKNSLILGVDAGIGTSLPIYKRIPNSDITPGFSYSINARIMLFLAEEMGMIFDIGLQSFNIFESDGGTEINHNLLYAFLNFSPFLRYKKFLFYFGPYIGFILKAKKEDTISTIEDTKDFNKPDLGLTLGLSFLLGKPDKTIYNLGLEIKYQLINFMNNSSEGNRCLNIYFKTGVYFSTKHTYK